MVLDNNSIVKLVRDMTLRLARLEKAQACAPTPTVSNPNTPPPPSTAGIEIIDYTYDIIEVPDGFNKIYTLSQDYVAKSTKIYVNGARQTPGLNQDYIEIFNKQISFIDAPPKNAVLIAEYKLK